MGNKIFFTILSFFGILFFSYYALVYSNFYKDTNINFLNVSSKNIYINSNNLNGSIVLFNSNNDLSSYKIFSKCYIKSEYLYSKQNIFAFRLDILDKNCKNNNLYLSDIDGNILTNTNFELNLISDFELYNKYTDLDFYDLGNLNEKINNIKDKFKLFLNVDEKNENLDLVQKSRHFKELNYNQKIIENILYQRQTKYEIPIIGYELPIKNLNKLPNGLRPYRANYTDGIHEGWDIDAPLGQEVVSIDSGIIVKVINDFKFGDLSKIKKLNNITSDDKENNLDILRGNQVWLKTMKGDVIFYAHLNKVYDDIKVGNIVPKGYPLGQVGKTGVPDKDYEDYHLHFELRKNPYLLNKVGKNTNYDYMNWDWYFKNETREYIKQNQYTIFYKENEGQFSYKK
ncbi:MAG: M23 family metallopeptidase [Candidatus Gracilibacteria bacterium]|nr:M23 family metallopeptidase [Candidatus Gracilibacteria bacterium]